ncbi:hypothetical protein NDU88_003403 [Pleurodeles waltl]|uniref:Uncharacterized protein n=1 Tax=Pleurodeles waltl TaxID=8319 RepID=A0AAV7KXC5_PLEWA|nr:hypothetical protein NDU88_003403 [Pleurodeles waltl]
MERRSACARAFIAYVLHCPHKFLQLPSLQASKEPESKQAIEFFMLTKITERLEKNSELQHHLFSPIHKLVVHLSACVRKLSKPRDSFEELTCPA